MNVAILGAGPAGMSCANACLSFGLTPVVIEQDAEVGGIQRGNFHPNLWLLGAPEETGREMSERMTRHFLALPLTCLCRARVVAVSGSAGHFNLQLATPEGTQSLEAGAIVIATGTHPRGTPALDALAGQSPRVILGPLSQRIRDDIHAARVLILGGGDNALDHALFLAHGGNRVRVCARRRLSARQPFQEACRAEAGIELIEDCGVDNLTPAGEHLVVAGGPASGQYDWLLVLFGYLPNNGVLETFAAELRPRLGPGGHLLVDAWQRTSTPGLYAAGDVTENPQPSVPTALAQGLVAARAVERDIE